MPISFSHSRWTRQSNQADHVVWTLSTPGQPDVTVKVEFDDLITDADADLLIAHFGFDAIDARWTSTWRIYKSAKSARQTPYNDALPGVQITRLACPGISRMRVRIVDISKAVEEKPASGDINWRD